MTAVSVKLYECTVQRVQPESRVIDVVSRRGRQFREISYLLPYINSLGGGVDCVPQEKDQCIVLAEDEPSDFAFCIGFRVPLSFRKESPDSLELADRIIDLGRGSTAVRAVGEDGTEARLICYRGGSVLISSGKLATTLYTPIGDAIIHLFQSWELIGPGGFVRWTRKPGSEEVTYDAEYRTAVDENSFKVTVGIGGDGDPLRLDVVRGDKDAPQALSLHVTSDGIVKVSGMIIEFKAQGRLEFSAPNIYINKRRVTAKPDPI